MMPRRPPAAVVVVRDRVVAVAVAGTRREVAVARHFRSLRPCFW